MAKSAKSKTNKLEISGLETALEDVFVKKLPSLPKSLKEAIVQYGPWLVLICLVLSLPSILALFGLGAISMPFSYFGGMRYGYNFSLNFVLTTIITILGIIALPGLFKRKKQSWNLLFYSSLLSLIQNFLHFNLGALVVGTSLSWYVLFQIKSYYKN